MNYIFDFVQSYVFEPNVVEASWSMAEYRNGERESAHYDVLF